MTSIAGSSVTIQTTPEPNISTPSWFGAVVVISSYLRKHGVLSKINGQVRFTRKRFGRYDVIDFLVVLFGYAISGVRTLEEFYARLQPFAIPFMVLFERDRLPARSALSRFLAALTQASVEALRTLFLDDLLARPPTSDKQTGGLVDRAGNTWVVFDIDGTREAARQRALPQTEDLPQPFADWTRSVLLAIGAASVGRLFGHGTTVSQAHSYQWLGTFGKRGNGRYREELRKGCALEETRAPCVSHPKAHLPSQSAWESTRSPETPKTGGEIGSRTNAGSPTGDAGEPGEENGGSRWSQICQAQRTLTHGAPDSSELLEALHIPTSPTGVDTQTGKSREKTIRHSHDV